MLRKKSDKQLRQFDVALVDREDAQLAEITNEPVPIENLELARVTVDMEQILFIHKDNDEGDEPMTKIVFKNEGGFLSVTEPYQKVDRFWREYIDYKTLLE